MKRTAIFSRTFALLIAAAWLLDSGHLASGQDDAGIIAEQNMAVPMRDGTILRANIFRPAQGGPFPVLVMRTPYGKPPKVDERLVKAGYIVVTQDARGRYASDGQYESFVREVTTDPDATGIVSAVIGMGRNLGMQVVAEGVESREQLACLQQLACPEGQGFYLGEPLSPTEFARLYRGPRPQ